MAPVDSQTLRTRVVCFVLFLGTLLLFSRAVNFGFTNYDDPRYVTHNPHVQAGLTWDAVRWAFVGRTDYWEPVTWLSHILDWQLYGSRAAGHHVTSVLWHAVNAVLLLLVLRRLTGAFWLSALCAALFAWHPLRVESVAWIAERKDVMSGLFFLLTLWAYTAYAERRRAAAAARLWYGLTVAAFAGGLMCKPTLVALPGLLLLLDFWPLRRFRFAAAANPAGTTAPSAAPGERWSRLVLEKLPLLLLSLAAAVVTVRMQETAGAFTLDLPLGARLANAVVSIPRYLGKFLWPFNLTVCYAHPGHWPAVGIAAAAVFVLVVTGTAAAQWRSRPWLLTGWLWFLGMLVPMLGLVQAGFQAMADRYTYLPIIGVQLALLWTLRTVRWPAEFRGMRTALAALVLGGLAVRTWSQEAVWRDSTTLYQHALAVTDRNYVAHFFLGATLFAEGRISEAEVQARQAVEINPDYAAIHDLLGDIQVKQSRPAEAAASYRRVLQLDPRNAKADYALGALALDQRQPEEAASHFQAAVRNQPDMIAAYLGLARVESLEGRPQAALHDYETALARQPDDATAQDRLALLLAARGRVDEAKGILEKSLQLHADNAETQRNYAGLLRNLGRWTEAGDHYRRAIALEPKDPSAHFGLAFTLERLGRTDDALASYTAAIKLDPDFAAAHVQIGILLLDRHQPAEAGSHFETALKQQPDLAPAYLGRGLVAEQLDRPQDAIADFQRALALNPGDPSIHRAWGDTLARTRQFDEAIAHYHEALRLLPNDAATQARLGYAYYLTGRRADAVRHWEEALRLDPSLPGLRERLEQARRE